MSPHIAWFITMLCFLVVAWCGARLAIFHPKSNLFRVVVVMGVTLTTDVIIAEKVHWEYMWMPLLLTHLVAAVAVLQRPATRIHAIVGSLYITLGVVDVVFRLHGNYAATWSMYMDMINLLTLAQAGALLFGVISHGHRGHLSGSSYHRTDRTGAKSLHDLEIPQ